MTEFSGTDGILGTRASLTMDLMVLLMIIVVTALGWSVYQVKVHRRYHLHKRVQIPLGLALLVAIVMFELDVRLNGWQDRAAGIVGGSVSSAVWVALSIHLVFAIASVILWPIVIVMAIRKFGHPPKPGAHSAVHVPWARAAAVGMVLTAVTSWAFYWTAFV